MAPAQGSTAESQAIPEWHSGMTSDLPELPHRKMRLDVARGSGSSGTSAKGLDLRWHLQNITMEFSAWNSQAVTRPNCWMADIQLCSGSTGEKNSYLLLSGWRGQCFQKEPVPCSGRSRFCPTAKHNGMNAELLWSLSNSMLNKRRWCGDNRTSPAGAVSSTLFCFIVGWWLPETTEAFLSLSTTWITPELLFALCLAAFRWQEHPERNRRQERGTDSLRIPTQLCTWKGMRLCGIWTL